MVIRKYPAPAQRPPQRRGVVLIFVVAVLVLLAVISTTYLSMTRVDRVSPEVRGGVVIADNLPDPTAELRLDLFTYSLADVANESGWHYRPADSTTGSKYNNFDYLDDAGLFAGDQAATTTDFRDRQLHDPWLASREPAAIGADFGWPKISRWLERWSSDSDWVFNDRLAPPVANTNHQGFFESPTGVGGAPVKWTTLTNVIPTYVRIDLPTTFNTPAAYAGKSVTYPAFTFPAGSTDAGKVVIAGDADGDGVPDSGLFPLDSWMTGTTRIREDGVIAAGVYPLDPLTHTTRWYAAVRIVDNNAAINVNTAWRRNFDWSLNGFEPASQYDTSSDATPNYGFFRSNIGLYELLPSAAYTVPPYTKQWAELFNYRFNEPNAGRYNTNRTDYAFSTVGEALEMNVGRRPLRPGPDAAAGGGATFKPYRAFGPALSANLAYLNGLVNPNEARSDLETALIYDLYQFVPNWGAADGAALADKPGQDTEKQNRSYSYFVAPPDVSGATGTARPELWWNSLYNTDTTTKQSYFNGIGAYTGMGGLPPRTVRQVLTSSNPLATTARGALSDTISPTWLTNMVATTKVSMEPFKQNTKAKVGVNTSTFGELWRNFFLTMKDPNNAVLQAAVPTDIDPNGRVSGTQVAAGENALYLRSAIAAVNTVDMRDGDDTITTYRIALPGGENVMVAGAEAQLFISKAVKTTVSGTDLLQFELYNPYADKINASAYRVGFYNPLTKAFSQMKQLTGSVASKSALADNFTLTVGDPLLDELRHLVLLRTRRADGTPTNTSDAINPITEGTVGALTDSELVCVDMVEFVAPLTAVASGAPYQRTTTDWKVASMGQNFTNATNTAFVRENPVAVPNRPSGVLAANQSTNNKFPLSGFPRDGDMMLIPYVGHYTFYSGPGASATIKDIVPVTIDVQRVPQPTATDLTEGRITGHFVPVPSADPSLPPDPVQRRSYDWRARIFDNFTTLANPMSDTFPNIANESWLRDPAITGRQDVKVVTDVDTTTVDEKAPVHGLVNINTASESVLNMVPFITNNNGVIDAATATVNLDVAKKVIFYRRNSAPYRSIIDLADALNSPTPIVASYPPATWLDKQGNLYASTNVLTPLPAAYTTKLQGFVRVSNLITTRSDSFTIYVLLQQWQDFGYPVGGTGGRYPLLVPGTEKRFALTVDRSQLIDGNAGEDMIRKQSVSTD